MNVYDYKVNNHEGKEVSLDSFKGKVLLIVNTASKCGFTPQYEGLEALYQKYRDKGLEILGFPSNQFAEQEPGGQEEILSFCKLNYGVTFPLFEKTLVRGPQAHKLFHDLSEEKPFLGFPKDNPKSQGLKDFLVANLPAYLEGNDIKWNFTKFLIDKNGAVQARFEPMVEPKDLEETIEALL